MQIKTSYFVKYNNGTSAWYAIGKEFSEEDMLSKEERPILCAADDKFLKNKETEEVVKQIWLKNLSVEDFEEISEEEAEIIFKEQERKIKEKMEEEIKKSKEEENVINQENNETSFDEVDDK